MALVETEQDIQPRLPDDLPPRKKGYFMDAAISKTKFGFFNYIIIFLSGIILFSVATETVSIVYVIPVLQCDIDITTSQKGILAGAGFFGVLSSSHLWGFLADTKGRRRVIQPTLFAAFTFSIISSFVKNLYLLSIIRFLNGFFMSGSAANIYAYLGEFHNNAQRTRAIMVAAFVFSTSCMIIPMAAWAIINQDWQFEIVFLDLVFKPWRLFLIANGLPGFLSAIALIFLPESPKFVLGQGNKMVAYQILQKINRWNNGKDSKLELFEIYEEPESIENRQRVMDSKESRFPMLTTIWNQTAPLFRPAYLRSTLLICTIQFGIYSTSNGFFMFFAEILNKMSSNLDSFVDQRVMMCDVINMKPVNVSANELSGANNEICNDKLELSTLENGIILELLFALGCATSGLLINKVGKFLIIFFILTTTGLCGFGCMLTDIPILQISLFLWQLSCSIAISVVSSVTVELYPTSVRAMALSISLLFGRLGGVTGSNIAALLLDDHCELTFYISGTSLLVVGVLVCFIPNIYKKVANGDQEQAKTETRLSVLSFRGSVKSF